MVEINLEFIGHKLQDIQSGQRAQRARFDSLEMRFTAIEARFSGLEARFGAIEARASTIEAHVEAIEGQLDRIEAGIATLLKNLGAALIEKQERA